MEPERKPLEKPEPNLKPVEPEMPKGFENDQPGATDEPPESPASFPRHET